MLGVLGYIVKCIPGEKLLIGDGPRRSYIKRTKQFYRDIGLY